VTLRLALACGDYDRTKALEEGRVRPDGIELDFLRLPVEETFFRMMRYREFEVAELSLSSYVVSMHEEPAPFVALPVYTSRSFRHGGIYVNADAGIDHPADLRGKVVGCPEFQLTACVWIRGILAEHYDVPVDSVSYRVGGLESPGRVEKAVLDLPASIQVQPIAADRTLAGMLLDGEIDALYSPRIPPAFGAGEPRIRRLFRDVVAEEQAYFERTRIFPIMHVVAVRRDVYERHPWVAQSLYKAFRLAKQESRTAMYDSSALRFMLPWLIQHIESAEALLGDDFWPYGLDGSRHTLEIFLRYHHEQGLSPRLVAPEELFAVETMEAAVI
jgi:4,5-dihydroxyphthalate decarboxylase